MKYLILLSLLIQCFSFSQSTSKLIFNSAGANVENDFYKLSFSTGEVLLGTMTDDGITHQIANGYHSSLDASVFITLISGSHDLQLEIRVFPNPASEAIFITHPTAQFFDVSITDVGGKQMLYTKHPKEQPLSLQNFVSGVYFVRVTTKDSKQTNTYKILKQ